MHSQFAFVASTKPKHCVIVSFTLYQPISFCVSVGFLVTNRRHMWWDADFVIDFDDELDEEFIVMSLKCKADPPS